LENQTHGVVRITCSEWREARLRCVDSTLPASRLAPAETPAPGASDWSRLPIGDVWRCRRRAAVRASGLSRRSFETGAARDWNGRGMGRPNLLASEMRLRCRGNHGGYACMTEGTAATTIVLRGLRRRWP
jgi:hypothetical protein